MPSPDTPLLPLPNDCFAHGERRLWHDEAIGLLRSRLCSIVQSERLSLDQALGRVLKGPVIARQPVPAHTNSAVDGYAFAHSCYGPLDGVRLPITGRSTAGRPYEGPVRPGSAVRILTGAVVPDGLDTVAMQEDCQTLADGEVSIPAGLKRGANIRHAGEDVITGTLLAEAGHCLRPQDLAALASAGCADVSCYQRLKVGIVSSGDEIVRLGTGPLTTGQVFDANQPMLQSLVKLAGCEARDLGVWRDDAEEVRQRLVAATASVDVVLTSGGASRGDEDHMAAAIAALGSVHFWQLAVKPGRPMMFGQVPRSGSSGAQTCLVVGLPGNPVAVFVCFLMYVMPMLRQLSGGTWTEPRRYRLPARFSFTGRKSGRREFWRGILVDGADGLAVDKYGRDGSGLISGLRAADGLIDIAEEAGDVALGDLVDFIPFSEFGILRA